MPRLVNARTGVIIHVSDEMADSLTVEWTQAAPAKAEAKSAKRGGASRPE